MSRGGGRQRQSLENSEDWNKPTGELTWGLALADQVEVLMEPRNRPQTPSRADGSAEPESPPDFRFFSWEFFSGPRKSNSRLCSGNFLKAFLCPSRAPVF